MRVGGTRRLEIAPHLGYGDRGVPGVIPAGAVLTAEITIVGEGNHEAPEVREGRRKNRWVPAVASYAAMTSQWDTLVEKSSGTSPRNTPFCGGAGLAHGLS
jgi:hypothetical protein